MAQSQKIPVDWKIKNLDSGATFEPPYPITDSGVRMSVGGEVAQQARFGFQDPITQWVQGRLRSLTFVSVLFAEDSDENILGQLSDVVKLSIKDETLGRPPICVFSWGKTISEVCMFDSVDPEIESLITTGASAGHPKHVTLNFTVSRYVPFSQQQIDPTKPAKESYYLVVSAALQTYEGIAKRYYGRPLLGDRLRKRNPDMPMQPDVGSTIRIPARAVVTRETVEPEFHALSLTNEEAVASFEEILANRNARKAVF